MAQAKLNTPMPIRAVPTPRVAYKVIRPEQLSAKECAFLQQWHQAGRAGFLNIGSVRMRLTPTWLEQMPKQDTVCVRLLAGNEKIWVEVPQVLLERILDEPMPEVLPELLPLPLRVLRLQQRLGPLLNYFEHALNRQLQMEAMEAHGRLDALIQGRPSRAPELTDYLLLTLQIDVESGGTALARLFLPAELARLLLEHMPMGSKPTGFRLPEQMLFPAFWIVGATQLNWAEIREIHVGCVILVEHSLLRKGRLGLRVGDDFLCTAALTKEGAQIEKRGFEAMADSEKPPAGDTHAARLPVKMVFELGRTDLTLGQLQSLAPGYVMQLGRDLTAPVDIIANGVRVARGQLVEVEGQVAVRVIQVNVE